MIFVYSCNYFQVGSEVGSRRDESSARSLSLSGRSNYAQSLRIQIVRSLRHSELCKSEDRSVTHSELCKSEDHSVTRSEDHSLANQTGSRTRWKRFRNIFRPASVSEMSRSIFEEIIWFPIDFSLVLADFRDGFEDVSVLNITVSTLQSCTQNF